MSGGKKGKMIQVDKLIIHAKEVDIIQEAKITDIDKPREYRDPWDFFWGRPHSIQENDQESSTEENETNN